MVMIITTCIISGLCFVLGGVCLYTATDVDDNKVRDVLMASYFLLHLVGGALMGIAMGWNNG